MSADETIVITGTGAVCGAGKTVRAIWESIVSGQSAIKPIEGWDASEWPAQEAAEVTDVDNRTLVEDRKLHKFISRTDMFGLYAGRLALEESGILEHRDSLGEEAAVLFNDRSGVFAGSGGGTYQTNYEFFPVLTESGGDMKTFGGIVSNLVNPMWLLRILPNNVVCHIGIRHGFKGTNACVTNQCASGALAVSEAAAAIKAGEADRVVVIGHDTPLEPETVFYYSKLGLMTSEKLRPFGVQRTGTLFGEGAASVMLEKAEDAKQRGATILGTFLGFGCVTEATGVVALRPDGDGVARAITAALEDAGISPSDIGMIVAHGNGTQASDASEAEAFRTVFGSSIPPVTAFKWAFGHLIAASGVLDLTLALTALSEGIVPGIPTLDVAGDDIGDCPVSREHRKPVAPNALVICRGFGGMNVAMIVGPKPSCD